MGTQSTNLIKTYYDIKSLVARYDMSWRTIAKFEGFPKPVVPASGRRPARWSKAEVHAWEEANGMSDAVNESV